MKIYRIGKHMSEYSHDCLLCDSNLRPIGFNRNSKHHFPWGITYKCGCGKSSIWTNSIRNGKEFIDIVINGGNDIRSGFCNDLYCGECYKGIGVIKNGLGLDSGRPTTWCHEKDKEYYITNWDLYIKAAMGGNSGSYNSNYMGDIAYNVRKYVDIMGCRGLKHNNSIIWNGSEVEYKEGEYGPIYNWCKGEKGMMPAEMIKEFNGDNNEDIQG